MLPVLAILNDLWPAGGNYTVDFMGLGMGRLILANTKKNVLFPLQAC